jgi:DNA-binding Lrp family transcriptional regulator
VAPCRASPPGIVALHDNPGRWDLLAELRVANIAELAAALERIRKVKGISATETSIHLQSLEV